MSGPTPVAGNTTIYNSKQNKIIYPHGTYILQGRHSIKKLNK